MIRVLLSGICGAMGKVFLDACSLREDMEVVAGVDLSQGETGGIPVYPAFCEVREQADILVDFSNPAALDSLYAFCVENSVPAVICTTGFTSGQETKIAELSEEVPVFKSANMSLGINLLANLAKTAAGLLSPGFDIEIVEKHHKRKVDAPSGTAMMLAKEINSACSDSFHYVYERESARQSRKTDEIGIHSIRGGTIVGDHDIIFAGTDEVITLSHNASSRSVFATGAIAAALFLIKQPPGLYSMNDLIAS